MNKVQARIKAKVKRGKERIDNIHSAEKGVYVKGKEYIALYKEHKK